MSKKSTVVAMFVLMAACLMACGDSCEGMFGEIPGIYEKEMVDAAKNVKEVSEKADGDLKAAMGALAMVQTALDEAEKEAKPIADQMVGKTVKVETGEGLPFKVNGDAKISKVVLPKMGLLNGGNTQVRLELTIEAEATEEMPQMSSPYYFLMDGDTPISYGSSMFKGMEKGKPICIDINVYAPDAPAAQIDRCSSIKFVSKETFEAQKDGIDKQLKAWNGEMAKEYWL